MPEDPYAGFADRYDWMWKDDPTRRAFFARLFAGRGVARLLDCACGTGRDLLLFRELGLEVSGSDLSEAMLARARENLAGADVPLVRADFRELPAHFPEPFDAVVCLGNAVNELLEDAETLRALASMRSVLRPGGILVLDQGQTDASMRERPRFAPVVNERDFTRLFTMDHAGDVMTVDIFDFLHTEAEAAFHHATVRIRVRLLDGWRRILREAGFAAVEFFGDWDGAPYDEAASRRLIAVARR